MWPRSPRNPSTLRIRERNALADVDLRDHAPVGGSAVATGREWSGITGKMTSSQGKPAFIGANDWQRDPPLPLRLLIG